MSLSIGIETKIDTEPCVVAWNNKLFVGAENGSILTFDGNLTPGASWTAHGVQLFAIAANEDKVYSASNDGGVRVWTSDGSKITEFPASEADIESIALSGKYVYAGDELGNIYVFEENNLKAMYNVLEEVKDIAVSPPFMFTARDLYVTVTEIKPDQSNERFITQHVMEGRAPLRIYGSRLVVTSRSGNSIQLHEVSLDSKFKKLHEVKIEVFNVTNTLYNSDEQYQEAYILPDYKEAIEGRVSDMILTSLSLNENYVWTGGWDGCVRRWKISEDILQSAGEINLGACINALVATTGDNAYVLITGGRIVQIKAP